MVEKETDSSPNSSLPFKFLLWGQGRGWGIPVNQIIVSEQVSSVKDKPQLNEILWNDFCTIHEMNERVMMGLKLWRQDSDNAWDHGKVWLLFYSFDFFHLFLRWYVKRWMPELHKQWMWEIKFCEWWETRFRLLFSVWWWGRWKISGLIKVSSLQQVGQII